MIQILTDFGIKNDTSDHSGPGYFGGDYMKALEKLEANELKIVLISTRGGMCEIKECREFENLQLAHRIPKTKANLKKYGEKVINHPLNLVVTCAKHNDSVLMNFATQPVRVRKLIYRIQNVIKTGIIW